MGRGLEGAVAVEQGERVDAGFAEFAVVDARLCAVYAAQDDRQLVRLRRRAVFAVPRPFPLKPA